MQTFKKHIAEQITQDLIIVDIQPAYQDYIHFQLSDFCRYLNKNYKKFNKIYFLYNGEEFGLDSWNTISDWYSKYGLNQVKVRGDSFEKNYGFFRDAMEKYDTEDIITLIRYMIQNNIRDYRDLDKDEISKINIPENFKSDLQEENISVYIPDVADLIKYAKNPILVGGGENECLAEIEILLSALNINYTKNRDFIF